MKHLAPALIAVSLLMPSLGHAEDPVLVRRDGGPVVTFADLDADAEKMPPEVRSGVFRKAENVRRTALNLLLRRVLAQQAEAAGLDKDPAVAARLRLAREKILSDMRVQQLDGEPPADSALEQRALAEYKAYPEKHRIPEEVRVSHILIGKYRQEGRKLAEELLERLTTGQADFGQVAYQYSDDPGTKAKQGDVGFFERGRMLKEFEEAAFKLSNPGELSGIVETQHGWHIIRLTERRAAGQKPFDEVKADLKRDIARRIVDSRRNAVIEPLEQSARFDDKGVEAFQARFR